MVPAVSRVLFKPVFAVSKKHSGQLTKHQKDCIRYQDTHHPFLGDNEEGFEQNDTAQDAQAEN